MHKKTDNKMTQQSRIKIGFFFLGLLVIRCGIESNNFGGHDEGLLKRTPVMGWASWNNYRIHINEEIIKSQVDAMVELGLTEAGYGFINIDDGYFGGRDADGNIISHGERFPSGMKHMAEYIHSKGLKAGIYSDAGINICASYWDKDTIGVGMVLFGHDEQDLRLFIK